MRLHLLDVDGTRIAVRDSEGSGSPVVCLHGNSISYRAFLHQLEGPQGRESFRLLAIDFPGHVESARASNPRAEYSFPGLAGVTIAVAKILNVSHGVFVGWSLGGHVLFEAAPHLSNAAGFCAFGAPPLSSVSAMGDAFLPHPVVSDLFKGELSANDIYLRVAACLRVGAPLPEVFLEDVRRTDPGFRIGLLESLTTVGFCDEVKIVGGLTQPLAIFHGSDDQVVSRAYLESIPFPTLWRGRVQVIEATGHAPQWEAPSAFEALLGAFVRSVAV
jgi:pimeloyl-ACP methyl ester carboxylesterase